MSRIDGVFEKLKSQGRKALVPYITAGDPHPRHTVALMHALVQGGADVLELGVPMADGPVIQLACERALAHGTSLWQVLEMVAEFRKTDAATPVVLMGYLNPIEARGYKLFAAKAREAGVDGVLVVDLAAEEAPEIAPLFRAQGLDCIFLLAPTLMEYGTEAQKQRFLPRMATGEDVWAQGWSEPGAGSDMAAIRSKAVRKGDHYVISGQKTWSTRAVWADWLFGLFRTDPESSRHHGLTFCRASPSAR